jgi:hypothetical protein
MDGRVKPGHDAHRVKRKVHETVAADHVVLIQLSQTKRLAGRARRETRNDDLFSRFARRVKWDKIALWHYPLRPLGMSQSEWQKLG